MVSNEKQSRHSGNRHSPSESIEVNIMISNKDDSEVVNNEDIGSITKNQPKHMGNSSTPSFMSRNLSNSQEM